MQNQPIAGDLHGRFSADANRPTPLAARSILLAVVAMFFAGCGDDPAPKPAQKPATPLEQAATPPEVTPGESTDGDMDDNQTIEGSPDDQSESESADDEDAAKADGTAETTSEPTPPPFDLTKATERFLFLTPQGPLIVDLVVAIDGAPYKAVIDGLIERLLETADGQPLTWEQALRDPRFHALRINEPALIELDAESQIEMWDANTNGLVEADEAKAFVAGSTGQMAEVGATVTMDESATRTVLGRWWRSMDTNRDGRLTADEATAVQSFLRQNDSDDDEVIRLRDILPSQLSNNDSRRETPPMLSVHVTELTNWNSVSFQLDERYLVDGELSPASFPLDPELFGTLDLSGDGYLRNDEVARLAEIAPHLIINVNFGESPHRPPGVHVLNSLSLLAPLDGESAATNVANFDISGSRLMFQSADAGGAESTQRAAMQFIARLDANQDGYLDPDEADANPLSAGDRFAILDADDNQMLVLEELVTPLTWAQAAQLTNVTISVRGEERSAFAALDANTDGRITAREMQMSAERLMSLDADGDGAVRYAELPTTINVEIRRANGNANSPGSVVESESPESLRWFTSMDTNDDGDISRREFLGSDEQFQMLDTNDDGLVDRAEALAAGDF